LPRGSISLRSLQGTELAELDVWGIFSLFEVVRNACLGHAKGCRGPFIPMRKDQVTCGNPACRQAVSRHRSSPRLQKKAEEEFRSQIREGKELLEKMR